MAQVLEIFWSSNLLKERILHDYNKNATSGSRTLIQCIKDVRHIAEIKVKAAAVDEIDREKKLKMAWKKNARTGKMIERTYLL